MTYKILVVDDEPDIIKILKTFLTKMGFEVIDALGGERALEILDSNIDFDMLIVDMKMPKVKGIDVLRRMKDLNKQKPVIILSGSIDIAKHEDKLRDLGYGHSEYLIKPIDLEVLLEKIKQALGIDSE
ncbi:MAG: response regulator [Candidatus Omnitrophota bacterium]